MALFTLYGFLEDEAIQQTSMVGTDEGSTFGKLSGECSNYFVNKTILNDVRQSRLSIISNNHRPYGHCRLIFDMDRIRKDIFDQLTDIDIIRIFNIIERIYLQQEYSDNNIEYQLTNNSQYGNYVPYSFAHSSNESQIAVKDERNNKEDNRQIVVKDWYSFDYLSGSSDIKIHFWIKREALTKEYPHTTITAVVPPFEPNTLINTDVMASAGNFALLTDASAFIFNETHKELFTRDQNGIYTYKTKYLVDSKRSIDLPFALAYCGPRVPNSLECRKKIREYLESTVKTSKEIVQELFPELYVGARFYVIPLWDKCTVYTDRNIFCSVHALSELTDMLAKAFANEDADFVNKNAEIILNSQNKMWCLTLPDSLNDNEIFSIYKEHPTYQDYSSQVPGFRYMDAKTQEFASKLTKCFAVLQGELTSTDYIAITINDRVYLSFMSGRAEFLVLTKDSYINAFSKV